MADLIAIGYPDETTALAAMDEVGRLERDLVIQPDPVAAIVRNPEGKLRVTTNHHAVGAGATWAMFWGLLFGLLFFAPSPGVGAGATNNRAVGAGATWGMFWGMLFGLLFFVPFLGMAVGAGFGALMGKVEKSGIDKEAEAELQDALHGQ